MPLIIDCNSAPIGMSWNSNFSTLVLNSPNMYGGYLLTIKESNNQWGMQIAFPRDSVNRCLYARHLCGGNWTDCGTIS